VLSALRAGKLQELADGGAEAVPELVKALEDQDADVAANAKNALGALGGPAAVDALCRLWAQGRDSQLGAIIARCGYVARAPVGVRVLSALRAGKLQKLADGGAEAVPELVKALEDQDADVAANAKRALENLPGQEMKDRLIDLILEDPSNGHLVELVNRCRYQHSIEGHWCLYLALAGRFEDYLAADYDFQALRPEFQAAPPPLQARIREVIVRQGDVRMNALFVTERGERLLAELSDHDAEVLVRVNARRRNWGELFRYFWVLPARHILAALRAMQEAGWRPEGRDDAELFDRLSELAAQIGKPSGGVSVLVLANPVFRDWLAAGESGALAQEPERALLAKLRDDPVLFRRKRVSECPTEQALLAKLRDDVPPPAQLAALGALRRRGKLDAATLAAAGRSPHWLVRLAAWALGAQVQHPDDGGREWFQRLAIAPSPDAHSLWGLKPCQVTSLDDLEALQENLARLPDRRLAGGLGLVEAIVAHWREDDIIVGLGAFRARIEEDDIEIERRPGG
jgi:hypothetical protein